MTQRDVAHGAGDVTGFRTEYCDMRQRLDARGDVTDSTCH